MTDTDKTLGVPTNLEYSLLAYAILIALALVLYLVFSPIIKGILAAI